VVSWIATADSRYDITGSFKGPLKGLDAGCGTGGALAYLTDRLPDIRFFGFDRERLAVFYSRQRDHAPILQGSVNDMPFQASTFDFIFSLDVIYIQGVDDRKMVAESYRALRDGGLLFLNVPAIEWLRGEHDAAVRTRHRYTRGEMKILLEQSGFKILKSTYWNTFLFPVILSLRLLRKSKFASETPRSDLSPLPEWVNIFFTFLLGLEIRLTRYVNLPIGSSVFCVAHKQAKKTK
jgi:SAM-dependent methyltransferase